MSRPRPAWSEREPSPLSGSMGWPRYLTAPNHHPAVLYPAEPGEHPVFSGHARRIVPSQRHHRQPTGLACATATRLEQHEPDLGGIRTDPACMARTSSLTASSRLAPSGRIHTSEHGPACAACSRIYRAQAGRRSAAV